MFLRVFINASDNTDYLEPYAPMSSIRAIREIRFIRDSDDVRTKPTQENIRCVTKLSSRILSKLQRDVKEPR